MQPGFRVFMLARRDTTPSIKALCEEHLKQMKAWNYNIAMYEDVPVKSTCDLCEAKLANRIKRMRVHIGYQFNSPELEYLYGLLCQIAENVYKESPEVTARVTNGFAGEDHAFIKGFIEEENLK